jgi:hypothetical protein
LDCGLPFAEADFALVAEGWMFAHGGAGSTLNRLTQ